MGAVDLLDSLGFLIDQSGAVLQMLKTGFSGFHVLVIGDVMVDRYVVGEVERISPEAPVPVLRQTRQYSQPGGAANVAMNLVGLGVQTTLIAPVGADAAAAELRGLLTTAGIDIRGLVETDMPTTLKTRVVSRTQQLVRFDLESAVQPSAAVCTELQAKVMAAVSVADAIVLSDYGKGALSEALCRIAIDKARLRGVPVLVDPKGRDFSKYARATTICPNLQELALATGLSAQHPDALFAEARSLLGKLSLDFLTVTMSEKGIHVLHEDPAADLHAPAVSREVFDVSGAGDTVIASLAASLAANLSIQAALQLANLAAGIVVGKLGTIPVTAAELIAQLTRLSTGSSTQKIVEPDAAAVRVNAWRAAGETIVFTNGCFDLLHIGHITLLEECRKFGSKIVVGLNADVSVARLKGPSRPIVNERERSRLLAALASVDLVVIFPETTPVDLIRLLRPAVLVKGGDYTVNTVIGHEDVLGWGGRVELVPLVDGVSSSKLLRRLEEGDAG